MYSTSDIYSKDNALFTMDDHITPHRYASSNVMRFYSRLYRLGNAAEITDDYRKELYSLAAYNENEAAILISSRKYEGKLELLLNNHPFTACSVSKIVGGGERGEGSVLRSKEFDARSGMITLSVAPGEVYLLTLQVK
jgi:hypothetical protein